MCTVPEDRSHIPDVLVEGALKWRPRHMRDKADQLLYEVADPEIR